MGLLVIPAEEGQNMPLLDIKETLRLHAAWVSWDVNGIRANLSDANLRGANLSMANLSGANLRGADLSMANLSGATGVPEDQFKERQIVPETGRFTAFKKVLLPDNKHAVAVLEIPSDARRLGGAVGRKCRADRADVVSLLGTDRTPLVSETVAYSVHDSSFRYCVGDTVRPANGFDPNMAVECAPGIHFFLSFMEAARY